MAVSDWSTNPTNNTQLNGYSLSGPYGHVFAVLMAEIKAAIDGVEDKVEDVVEDLIGEWTEASPARTTTVKAAIEAAETSIAGIQTDIGAWTDAAETTAVKAAIEALRPSGD